MSDQLLTSLLQQCTVRIPNKSGNGYGTGFFVSPGKIITCAHVIGDSNRKEINILWQGRSLIAQVENFIAESIRVANKKSVEWPDLALLTIDFIEHPCVLFYSEINLGDELFSFGYSDDYINGDPITAVYEGISNSPEMLKFKLGQVRPGLSGSPLLNLRTGGVCGVIKISRDRNFDLGGRAISLNTVSTIFPEILEANKAFHQKNVAWIRAIEANIPKTSYSTEYELIDESKFAIFDTDTSLYTGSEPTWKDIANNNDSERDLQKKVLDVVQVHKGNAGFLLISGEPGSGKSTFLRRLGFELFKQNKTVLFHLKNSSQVSSHLLLKLFDLLHHRPLYILIDDVFRKHDIQGFLNDLVNINLPIFIIATSRLNELEEIRANLLRFTDLEEFGLGTLNSKETDRLLTKLIDKGELNWELSTLNAIKEQIPQENHILVLLLRLLKSQQIDKQNPSLTDFYSIIEDELKSFQGRRKGDLLFDSYTYICALYTYGVSTPISLLEKLTNSKDIYRDVINRTETQGLIILEQDETLRARHEYVAEIVTKLVWPQIKQVERTFEQIISRCAIDEDLERATILSLLKNLPTYGNRNLAFSLLNRISSSRLRRILEKSSLRELTIEWVRLFDKFNNLEWQEKSYEIALEQYPNNVTSLLSYARFLEKNSDYRAEKYYETAYFLESGETHAANSYAAYLIRLNRFDEALRILESTLESSPENNHLMSTYALLLIRQGKYDEAEGIYRSVIESNPYDTYAYTTYAKFLWGRGDINQSLTLLEKAIEKNQHSSNLIDKYIAYSIKLNKLDQAISLLNTLLDKHPQHFSFRNQLINLHLKNNDLSSALDQAQLTLYFYPENLSVRRRYIGLLEKNGDLSEAYRQLESYLLEIEGTLGDFLSLLKLAKHLGLPDPDRKIRRNVVELVRQKLSSNDFNTIPPLVNIDEKLLVSDIEETPTDIIPRLIYARFLIEHRPEDFGEDFFKHTSYTYEDTLILERFLISFLIMQDEFLKAEEHLYSYMAREKSSPWANVTLLDLLKKKGDDEEFRKLSSQISENHPSFYPSQLTQINYLIEENEFEEAHRIFEEMLQHNPYNPQIRRKFVDFLIRKGDLHNAELELNTLLHFSPDDIGSRLLLMDIIYARGETKQISKHIKFLEKTGNSSPRIFRRFDMEPNKQISKEELENTLANNPTATGFLNEYVELLEQENSFDEAEQKLKYALSINSPPRASLRRLYASFLEKRGRDSEAEENYILAIQEHPEKPGNYTSYALLLDRIGERSKALTILENGKQNSYMPLMPKRLTAMANVAHQQGRIQTADNYHRLSLLADNEDHISHLNYAVFLKDVGRMSEAENHFKYTIKLKPDHVSAHQAYAILLGETNQRDKAKKCFEHALELDPSNVPVLSAFATFLFKRKPKGWENQIESLFQKALELDENHVQSRLTYALYLKRKNRDTDAEVQFKLAISVNENTYASKQAYAIFLKERGRYEEAKNMFESSFDPRLNLFSSRLHNAMVHTAYANLLIQTSAPREEIETHFKESLKIKSSNNQARFNELLTNKYYAEYLCRIGDLDAAIEHFEAALKINPRNSFVRNSYARCLERNGKLENALRQFNEILEFDPRQEHAIGGAAKVMMKLGQHEEARTYLKNGLHINPKNPHFLRLYNKLNNEDDIE